MFIDSVSNSTFLVSLLQWNEVSSEKGIYRTVKTFQKFECILFPVFLRSFGYISYTYVQVCKSLKCINCVVLHSWKQYCSDICRQQCISYSWLPSCVFDYIIDHCNWYRYLTDLLFINMHDYIYSIIILYKVWRSMHSIYTLIIRKCKY